MSKRGCGRQPKGGEKYCLTKTKALGFCSRRKRQKKNKKQGDEFPSQRRRQTDRRLLHGTSRTGNENENPCLQDQGDHCASEFEQNNKQRLKAEEERRAVHSQKRWTASRPAQMKRTQRWESNAFSKQTTDRPPKQRRLGSGKNKHPEGAASWKRRR